MQILTVAPRRHVIMGVIALVLLGASTTATAASSASNAEVASSSACGGSEFVETLTVTLHEVPAKVRGGSTLRVPVTVTRAGVPASGAEAYLSLRDPRDPVAYTEVQITTDLYGRGVLALPVPRMRAARLQLQADALVHIVSLPCAGTYFEHGSHTANVQITR